MSNMSYSDYKQYYRIFLVFSIMFGGFIIFDDLVMDEFYEERIHEYYKSTDRYAIGLDNGIMLSLTPGELCDKLENGSFDWDDLSPNMRLMMDDCKP